MRAKRPTRLPTVRTEADVHAVLAPLTGQQSLMAQVVYGSGVRLWRAAVCG